MQTRLGQAQWTLVRRWFSNSGPFGFDPYDVRAHPLCVRLLRTKARAFHKGFTLLTNRFPVGARRILGVGPTVAAETLGLLARGYFAASNATGEEELLRLGLQELDSLKSLNVVDSGNGIAWGLPFDWQSRIFFPQGTMMSTTTVGCALAFLEGYRHTCEDEYLSIAENSARTLLGNLRLQRACDGSTLCFSYTPIDRFHVHNANLLVAQLLVEVDAARGSREFREVAQSSLDYSLSDQREDGAFEYWGPPDRAAKHVDHYHTGFILRALMSMQRFLQQPAIERGLQRGVEYYTQRFFDSSLRPLDYPDGRSLTNIRSCAEALLVHAELGKYIADAQYKIERILQWIDGNMLCSNGVFRYSWNPISKRQDKGSMPYTRWAQAPMFYALARVMDAC